MSTDVKSPWAHRSASQCSHFQTRPSFWRYLAPIKISRWYLKQFKTYCAGSYTHPLQTDTSANNNHLRYRCAGDSNTDYAISPRKINTTFECVTWRDNKSRECDRCANKPARDWKQSSAAGAVRRTDRSSYHQYHRRYPDEPRETTINTQLQTALTKVSLIAS